jgi:hypothetical protein
MPDPAKRDMLCGFPRKQVLKFREYCTKLSFSPPNERQSPTVTRVCGRAGFPRSRAGMIDPQNRCSFPRDRATLPASLSFASH